jgi:ADP/ATP carrier protein family
MFLNKTTFYRYKFKEIFWPIERSELKLFVPMALMMFCILFNFAALRSVKDALVVPSMGAEVISFLKLWFVLPSSVLMTIIYVKLSNKLHFEYIFYILVSSFLAFFLLFAFVIYPNQCFCHPEKESLQQLIKNYPNFKWFLIIVGKWSYAVMYIISELWSAVIINLMFWQFANNIFDTSKAKRFYPILGMVGNLGLVLAGNAIILATEPNNYPTHLADHSELMLQNIILIIVIAGIISMLLFKYINYSIEKEEANNLDKISLKLKTSLSINASIKLIIKSKYIGHIALLIICYGLLINILEGPWKAKLRELYPNSIDYLNFMGRFNIWMGICSVTFMIIGSNMLRKLRWLISAMLTPTMFAATGTLFFTFVIFAEKFKFMNYNLVYAAVLVGAVQNILSKSSKYSLFDSTKEMAYIPLSYELKTKGKAAVEVIGTNFGKALGAFVQSSIFIILPNADFDSIVFYLLIVFIIIIILWFWNIIKLNYEYNELLK